MELPSTEVKKKRGRPIKRRMGDTLPYEVTKAWVQRMGFLSRHEWRKYIVVYRLPRGIPVNPHLTYKEVYEGDAIFFGKRPLRFLPYKQAMYLVRSHGIKSRPQYVKFAREYQKNRRHSKLPTNVERCVQWKNEWTNWRDFLGTNNLSTGQIAKQFLPYEEAKAFVHQLNLKNMEEWAEYVNSDARPMFLPKMPWVTYKGLYSGSKDWLGTNVCSALQTRTEQLGVWAITRDPNDVAVYHLLTFKGGKPEALLYCKKTSATIVTMYTYEYNLLPQVHEIIHKHSSSFAGNTFITNNFNELRFQLDMMLLIIR